MGAQHGHTLHYHAHSPVHRLPAQVKLVALVGFVLVVVLTPTGMWWVLGADALLLGVVVAASQVPPTYLLPRMLVEVPFLVFAALLPFIATGPRIEVAGLSVSADGLVAAGTLSAKATLGVLASLTFAATTQARDIVVGLQRLRVPGTLVAILAFMIRYTEIVTDDLRRVRVAQQARGFQARSIRHWPVLAATMGALFVRAYERGERVHLAMLARGYAGQMPSGAYGGHRGDRPGPPGVAIGLERRQTHLAWALGASLPLAAALVLVLGLLGRPGGLRP